jgi:hypothetical protein
MSATGDWHAKSEPMSEIIRFDNPRFQELQNCEEGTSCDINLNVSRLLSVVDIVT